MGGDPCVGQHYRPRWHLGNASACLPVAAGMATLTTSERASAARASMRPGRYASACASSTTWLVVAVSRTSTRLAHSCAGEGPRRQHTPRHALEAEVPQSMGVPASEGEKHAEGSGTQVITSIPLAERPEEAC